MLTFTLDVLDLESCNFAESIEITNKHHCVNFILFVKIKFFVIAIINFNIFYPCDINLT